MKTTMGQLMINEALPEELRDYGRSWDRKTLQSVLRDVATRFPNRYPAVSQALLRAGQSAATTGNFSFSLADFQPTDYKVRRTRYLRDATQKIIDDNKLSKDQKVEKLTMLLGSEVNPMVSKVLAESVAKGNRLAELVQGGSKGSPSQFNITVGAPLMVVDYKGEPIPMPILSSISEGLDPAEFWAASYGSRAGTVSAKFATREAGYFGKKLALAMQRGVVTEDDCATKNGILADGDDTENIGTILQIQAAGIPAGTILKPEHVKRLQGKKIVVRSPVTCEAETGLCSRCAGIRESGRLPEIGDHIGMSAALALGERLSQTMLSAKHTGGVAGSKKNAYTFQDVERLFEMPAHNIQSAAVAQQDGVVKAIQEAPAGGVYVKIGDMDHWVPSQELLKVKEGQHVEAGDVISVGIPNPKDLAVHRGIGDARMQFIDNLREVVGASTVSRRNAELVARGLISHVRVTDNRGLYGTLPGDVVRYDDLVRAYEPSDNAKMTTVATATGKYLEQPILHYTIGTRLNKRVVDTLKNVGIKSVLTRDDPPGFEPNVQRMYMHSQYDPDWMARLSGYGLEKGLLKGVHRGDISETPSTSFVPALAKGVSFGEDLAETGKY